MRALFQKIRRRETPFIWVIPIIFFVVMAALPAGVHNPYYLDVLINIFLSYLLTAHRIRSMAWTFHHTDEEHRFITSDNPMQVYDPKNPHSVDLDDERYETFRGVCPLSQEVCWEGELSQSETRYVYCDEAKAAQLNTLQARGAARYVIAPTKDFPASDVIHHPRGG